MGYSVDEYFDDFVKGSKDYDDFLSKVNETDGRGRVYSFLRGIFERLGEGNSVLGIYDYLLSPYGEEADLAQIVLKKWPITTILGVVHDFGKDDN